MLSQLPSHARQLRVQELYARYSPIIRKRCQRLLGDAEAAEDATQEIFIRVLRHVGKFHRQARLLPWIQRICTHYCLNQLRNRTSQSLVLMAQVPEASDDGFENRAASRELAMQFQGQLPSDVWKVFELVHQSGLTQEKIARMLGMSRRTLTYRLAQVSQKARQWQRASVLA